jgi:hypothetical protein
MEEAHNKAIETLKRELAGSAESREKALSEAHANEVEKLRLNAENEKLAFANQHKLDLETALTNLTAMKTKELEELSAALNESKRVSLLEQENKHELLMNEHNSKHKAEKESMLFDISNLQQQLAVSDNLASERGSLLEAEKAENGRLREQLVRDHERLSQENEASICRERERTEREVIHLFTYIHTYIKAFSH